MELSRGVGGELYIRLMYIASYLYMVSCSKEEKGVGHLKGTFS